MRFEPPLIPGTLIRRYKRFLADVELDNGQQITCSVPNTGSMMGLSQPGFRVWLSMSADPKRKYVHRLEVVEANGILAGINTGLPNRLTEEAIDLNLICDLKTYDRRQREQRYGENSRIDLLLSAADRPACYVEVKNVHLVRNADLAEFPDSVTTRGAKHLDELARMVDQGHRAVMVYLIQRHDCSAFALCRDLDPGYAAAFDRAMTAGVEAYAVRCHVSAQAIVPDAALPILEGNVGANTRTS